MKADLFAGDVGARIGGGDWAATELGPIAAWPTSLRSILATMLACPTAMFLAWGPQLRSFYNDAYEPILGYRAKTALGMPFRELWASIWDDIAPLVDEALAGRQTRVVDMRLDLSRSGAPEESFWTFTYSPAFDDDGAVAGLLCVTAETTDRVLAERARRASDERMDLALAAGAIIGTWFWDVPSDRFAIDDAFARAFGLDPALGREGIALAPIVATVHPDDQAGLAEAIAAALAGGGAYSHQYRVRRADGRYYWIEANGRVDLAADGTPLRFPGVLLDIEDRRRVEAERDRAAADLRALNETLEQRVADRTAELVQAEEQLRQSQKVEAIGQLTGGVAHDFNNLLTVIRGSVDLLRRPDLTEARRLRYIDAVADAADRAAKLTNQLLAFARRQSLRPERFDVVASVRSIADMVRTLVGARVEIALRVPDAALYIDADRSQFDTAIVNMAVNARDAMRGDGRLTIAVARASAMPPIRSHPAVEGAFVAVTLADSGPGIAAGALDQIFEPFFTTKGVGEGTGLGLSQVFGFTKQSGGDVVVRSEAGEGAAFTMYLPRVDAPAPAAAAAGIDAAPPGTGGCVLVVEDNAEVGRFATQALAELGYTTVWAEDGAGALAALAAGADRFDLVFSDVMMPGMSGIDLGQEIARRHPDLPVVLTSGYSEVLAQTGSHGFDLVHKPYSIDELARAFGRIARRR